MRRVVLYGAAAIVLIRLVIALFGTTPPSARAPAAAPKPAGTAGGAGLAGYEGSDLCVACHAAQHGEWSGSLHARTVHEPTPTEKSLLSRALLCGNEHPVLVLGERHSRRFMVPSPVEPGRHALLPCRYDTGTAEWVSLHEQDWKTLTWERSCGACHTVGFSSESLGFAEMGVGCESCHGPASRHGGYKTGGAMISFARLSAKEEVVICASCHLQGGRSRATGLNYARNYQAGDDLFADYDFDWESLDEPAPPDASPIDRHQKLLIRDAVRKDRGDLRCSSCHEFHQMGHAIHEKLARQEFCHLCHDAGDFKLKEYDQSCNVCEF